MTRGLFDDIPAMRRMKIRLYPDSVADDDGVVPRVGGILGGFDYRESGYPDFSAEASSRDGQMVPVSYLSAGQGVSGPTGQASEPGLPETQTALNWLERRFITDDMARTAKGTLNDLTNKALPPAQIDGVYDQVIRNVPLDDAKKFFSINPSERPVTLTPEQKAILENQINQLKPDDQRAVQEQVDAGIANGTITCPTCGK